MKPKTEEFLYFLLYAAEKFMRPSFRNLDSSFESWAYRNGLTRQMARLERDKFIERDPSASPKDRLYRLTAQGRLHALGAGDVERASMLASPTVFFCATVPFLCTAPVTERMLSSSVVLPLP